jgi:glutathione peroxidase
MNSIILTLLITMATNFHQFEIQQLNSDETIRFSDFKGKKILVVNVASKCGYTPQYEDLQAFYQQYQDQVVVIGFPCNQFGGQEPGTEAIIQNFCKANYGVTFPMTTKLEVKGKDQHPIYAWLTQKEQNGVGDYRVGWNFNKFLIDENGNLIDHFGSGVNPFDEKILKHLDQ